MVIADKCGYFAAEGIQVSSTRLLDNDSMLALGANQINVEALGVSPGLFNALARGVILQVVADGSHSAPGFENSGLAVRQALIDSGKYRKPQDLKGLTVGISAFYSALHFDLKLMLESTGLTLSDVKVVPMPTDQLAAAFSNGGIDATVIYEPFLSQLEVQHVAKVVGRDYDMIGSKSIGTMLTFSSEMASNHEGSVRYLVAWLRAVRTYLQARNNPQTRDVLFQLLNANGIFLKSSTQTGTFDPNGTFPGTDGLTGALAWYRQAGVVKDAVDVNKLVNQQFVREAAQRLPSYSG